MMCAFFQAVRNPPGATVTSTFEEDDGRKVFESGCFLELMEGRHPRRATEMRMEEGGSFVDRIAISCAPHRA